MNDALELNLETLEFKNIKIQNQNEAPFFEMHTSHIYKGTKLLLIGGRSHCLPTQNADPEAMQKVMASPFRDVILSLDLESG